MGRDAGRQGPGTAPGTQRMRGAGLIEALIALGLLAGATLGTLRAFTGAERGGHSAWLRLVAVDLAAEAAEQLRTLPTAANWDVGAWQAAVAAQLPSGEARADADAQGYSLSLRWADRSSGDMQQLTRRVDLRAAP